MKITAAVVPVRSAPFEIETLDLAAPLAEEVLVRVVASGMCEACLFPLRRTAGRYGRERDQASVAQGALLRPKFPITVPYCNRQGRMSMARTAAHGGVR
jgi:hypothetical protein